LTPHRDSGIIPGMSISRSFRLAFVVLVVALLLHRSEIIPGDPYERARAFTRSQEFDYVSWTFNALWGKITQWALGTSDYLSEASRKQTVLDYLDLVRHIQQVEAQLDDIYADPHLSDPNATAEPWQAKLDELKSQRSHLEPLAESILQSQISEVASDLGLTFAGQPIPPVLYHITPPPDALIISPRQVIRQDFDISIQPGLTADQQAELEGKVDRALDVSSLVVGIGGVGLYPTMVMQTTDLNWLAEVVSHEWTHNYLTLRPLGMGYETSPELRIMNETAANIAGKEIGRAVIARFYPELLPPPPSTPEPTTPTPNETPTPPVFDYIAEMRETRVTVDKLLAEGKVTEAETYMEERRLFFWDNGYHIRKINQAYFAFYGAYADEPGGGAAGEDPVGAAVRALRSNSSSLAVFINHISWMTSFNQLQQAVEGK
jgi:hypothetical protein